MGSMSTCDPGDIYDTIDKLVSENIRVSVISLAAEVYVCKKMAEKTGGSYGVCLNEEHFQELVNMNCTPPPASSKSEISLIRMGFPERIDEIDNPSFCSCHYELKSGGFICPQCNCKSCELSSSCPVCGLTLISSTHLARSYHHLFPISLFEEKPIM